MKRRSFLQVLLGTGVIAATGISVSAAEPVRLSPILTIQRGKHRNSDIKGWGELASEIDKVKKSIESQDRRSRGLLVIERNGVNYVVPQNVSHRYLN
jgi:hypothetical protein